MNTRMRLIALALGALIFSSACTAEESKLYRDATEHVRDVLDADELARLRQCESTDNYQAVSSSGAYRGAYQFDQTTWDDAAGRHFPWLTGRDPVAVEPWWQDAMARAL